MRANAGSSRATAAEREAVDAVLGPPDSPWAGGARDVAGLRTSASGRDLRTHLLPALHAVQDRVGWIGPGALDYVSTRLSVPPAEAYGVASFYRLLATSEQPPVAVHVCDDIACRTGGALEVIAEIERARAGGGAAGWMVQTSPCLGHCDRAPAALVRRSGTAPLDVTLAPASAADLVAAAERGTAPHPGTPARLEDYRARGGYVALARAHAIGPLGILRELRESRLVGRGGAAFPVAAKWEAVATARERPHYVVCNGDESEPGAFKDRVLMEDDPFAIVEGITIAAYAAGADTAYLYIRGEYPLALARMTAAIAQAREAGLLGPDVMRSGTACEVEVRRGAGAYVCGEETALFNSIEGRRGEPRIRPPYPVARGLFGAPTVVNNVETLACIPRIVRDGGARFASVGTAGSTGTKLFSVSGRVREPGAYEVAFGATVRDVIARAGGVREGHEMRAVLVGGAAGTFLRPDEIDIPLTVEGMGAAGGALGSGVIMVFDETVDLADVVTRIAAFFREESCGQCVPCRIGTVRQEESLRRFVDGTGTDEEVAVLDDLARVMRDASICGLGQSASSAVRSALVKLALRPRSRA